MIQVKKTALHTCMGLLFTLAACLAAYPQVTGGTFSGTVTDSSGAVIPAVQISILDVATGVTRTATTDAAGFYTAPNLLPGTYEITAAAGGFATEVRAGITLTVGAQQVLNIRMQVGTVTEKIQVTGEAPMVQLATSSISAIVDSTTVRELPLNGRSWSDLATLQPGVMALQTQTSPTSGSGQTRDIRGYGNDVTISGARPQQNNYRVDGISINDYGNGSPGSVLGGNLGVDAVEEFSVLTSNYSTEYGRTSGGVVSAATRSGTNQFHGGVYEFFRNSALDARNFFDGNIIPPFKRNQFGASAGGPIRKQRTFIFGDYEGIRQSKGITRVDTVPSAAARAGHLSTGTVVPDIAAQKYLGFYQLPNGPLSSSGDTGRFTFAGQQLLTENFFVTRVDDRLSDKSSLSGTYTYDEAPFTTPDNLNTLLLGNLTKRQLVSLERTHTFNPSLVNVVRFGFNRVLANGPLDVASINPLVSDTSLGLCLGIPRRR